MATTASMNGSGPGAFVHVMAALATMQSKADREHKDRAHTFLEQFQKSTEAWTSSVAILQERHADDQAKLFAATTLKGKVRKHAKVRSYELQLTGRADRV